MRYSIGSFILAGLLLVALACPALADEKDVWERPTCVFAMPVIGHAVQRHQTGLINDIFQTVFLREGIAFRHEEMPYNRAVQAVESGTADCTLDIGTQTHLLQSRSVIATYDLAVAYMRGTEWKGVQSLKEQKVAYLHGFDISRLVDVEFLPQLVYDLTSAFHMLDRDFATYILDDNKLLRDALFESRLPAHLFEIAPIKTFLVRPVFADTENGRKLRDIFDRRIPEMLDSGEFVAIMEKYDIDHAAEALRKLNGK